MMLAALVNHLWQSTLFALAAGLLTSQVAAAQAEVQRAREQEGGSDEDNAKLRSADATLKKAELDLANTEIRARSKGLVTDLRAEVGQFAAAGNPVLTPAAIVDDTVYASSGATLYAIDLATGVANWTYPAGDVILTAPAIADGLVVFGSRDGFLYAIGGDGAPMVDES